MTEFRPIIYDSTHILEFLSFCKERNISYTDSGMPDLVHTYYHLILDGKLTPNLFLYLHDNQMWLLDEIREYDTELVDHSRTESDCFEPDHPKSDEIRREYEAAVAQSKIIQQFIKTVLET